MRRLFIAAIRAYQRHLSPHKGFHCAYRVHTGHASCSALGLRALRRHGVWRGLAILRRRIERCGVAHRRWHPPAPPLTRLPMTQRGVCDGGCDLPCDGPCDGLDGGGCGKASLRGLSNLCDISSYCDCSGCNGCGPRDRRKRPDDQARIPVRGRGRPAQR